MVDRDHAYREIFSGAPVPFMRKLTGMGMPVRIHVKKRESPRSLTVGAPALITIAREVFLSSRRVLLPSPK